MEDAGYFNISPDEPVYVIGVVSRLVSIPIWTLRILDREKVICPKKVKGKTRYYSLNDLRMLERVSFLMHEKRVNIHGVKMILEMETHVFSMEGEGDVHPRGRKAGGRRNDRRAGGTGEEKAGAGDAPFEEVT